MLLKHGCFRLIEKTDIAFGFLFVAYFRQKLKFGLLIKKTVITDLMNRLEYVYIFLGESVIVEWNLREFRMIYAFYSAKKRYDKTFVHIINNTLMRTIIDQLLFDK